MVDDFKLTKLMHIRRSGRTVHITAKIEDN
jgi:hypothetical protein